jgi:hypothetical protein
VAARLHRQRLLVTAVAVAAFAAAALIVWWSKTSRTGCPEVVATAGLQPDTVSALPCLPGFLVVNRSGQPAVYLAASPHLVNEILEWDPDERVFVSAAHGETFDVKGEHLDGPAARDMFRCDIEIRDGQVLITAEELREAAVRYDCGRYSAFVRSIRSGAGGP